MRIALIAVALVLAAPARAGVPLALAERQVVTLEYDRAVARLAVTDPELLSLQANGARVRVGALRGGRATLDVIFDDGASLSYDVTVEPARRPTASGPAADFELRVGEEGRRRAPGVARVLVEENGVARVRVEGDVLAVTGVSPGAASLVVEDTAGLRTTFSIRVR